MNTDYTKLPARKLRAELKRETANWRALPNRRGFSALYISGRLNEIQQELDRRGLPFEPIYCEVNIEVG